MSLAKSGWLIGVLNVARVAWLAAAVDTRVVGVAPAVIETLDIVPNLNFEYQVRGAGSLRSRRDGLS